ncbi:glycosyltransferase family 2 protein [Cypionkella sp.]|uniref:glycosyltransferase family 2 protein n=1 Tax=Cypionkella sp. TaxID=2811411 RepID=UPI0026394542|nr:glycosyltransferase family 2 protein [Cypionkella sp.]MDB5664215.1 glycosyltransferase family 2 protein [Cypionkella sp.]
MRATALLGVKNEGAFLLEWLAHHRACGFTDFLLYSNDCSDGTDAMLDRLAQLGWLTHIRNDGPHPEGPQWAMLKAADKHPAITGADWLLFSDIDEFVNIHVGDRTLKALFAALPDATAIALTWRMFGNAGAIEISDQPITETFTLAAPVSFAWPWRAQLFKTLFRNDGSYRKLGVHRPRSPNPDLVAQARWFDGSGRALPASFAQRRIFSDYSRDNYQLVQLNHYALGSMQNYLVKADRGRANRDASAFDMSYWVERNFSEIEDRSILQPDSSLQSNSAALRAELRADPILGPLHDQAVAWRRARFDSLMQQEPWRALFGRLLMTPASHTLQPERAAYLLRHAQVAVQTAPVKQS